MFAVIQTGGKQYLVSEGDTISVEKLEGEKGSELTFDQVLIAGDENDLKVGTPFLSGASVSATVDAQGRAKKVRVVKFKRKVRYKRTAGHRQPFTKVTIKKIAA